MQLDPAKASEWIDFLWKLAVILGAVVGFTLKFIRAPLVQQLNGLGERVGKVEKVATATETEMRALERAHELEAFHRSANAERMGRIESRLDRLLETLERERDEDVAVERRIAERLAAFEAKVDVAGAITTSMDRFATAIVAATRRSG